MDRKSFVCTLRNDDYPKRVKFTTEQSYKNNFMQGAYRTWGKDGYYCFDNYPVFEILWANWDSGLIAAPKGKVTRENPYAYGEKKHKPGVSLEEIGYLVETSTYIKNSRLAMFRISKYSSVKGVSYLSGERVPVDEYHCHHIIPRNKGGTKELGKGLKKIAMLILQDSVWNRVTVNRAAHKTTWFYIDEMHLLLKEEQTAAYTVEIWKRFRKWGGIPSGLTQNVKDFLTSKEVENIFENSDFVYMLNQAQGDRQILAKQLGISNHQLSYVTHSGPGEGLLFYGSVIIPFVDRFPKDTELYSLLTTRPSEVAA